MSDLFLLLNLDFKNELLSNSPPKNNVTNLDVLH